MDHQQHLKTLVLNNHALYQRLEILRTLNPRYYLAAGVIRQLVWTALHQQENDISGMELDVVFFDPLSENQKQQADQAVLKSRFPLNEWDIVNQATVHQWYIKENGQPITPYPSLEEALSCWPETATVIAVRLTWENGLEIIAPFGLADLFELKLRWNPKQVSYQTFLNRVSAKQWKQRWPKLVFAEPFPQKTADL